MADYPGAIEMYVDRSRVFIDAAPDDVIVVHKTAGFQTIEQLGEYFATTSEMTSSHFGVGLDGRVAQYVRLQDGAAANCCLNPNGVYDHFWDAYSGFPNKNKCTISIEHIDPKSDNSTSMPQAQRLASFKLIKWLMVKKGIPWECVKGHFSLDGVNRKNCPGNYPWDELKAYVEEDEMHTLDISEVGSHFTQRSDGAWVCKNGIVIKGRLLEGYRNIGQTGLNGLTLLGLPIENEVKISDDFYIQKCERAALCYDPTFKNDKPAGQDSKNGCYLLHLDSGVGKGLYGGVQPVKDSTKQALSNINVASAVIAKDLGI